MAFCRRWMHFQFLSIKICLNPKVLFNTRRCAVQYFSSYPEDQYQLMAINTS